MMRLTFSLCMQQGTVTKSTGSWYNVRLDEESPDPRVEDLNKYVLDDNPDPRWIGPLHNT